MRDSQENESRIVVATFFEPAMAHLAQAKLRAEGIEAFVRDAHIVGIQWLYASAVGGVKVEVAHRDAERAQAILQADDSEVLLEEVWSLENGAEATCPCCGSGGIDTEDDAQIGFWSFIREFPLLFYRSRHTCRACGYTWKQVD